ncbi:P-loop containing nucleoside triphosphate hydrolases superfamily protein [Perilla frutescens var. frutescens]|nr:P-loop containing nucleoside triphosphate hydrolases superfamily protein [Perilla frutescens var. frutescens]
MPETLSGLVTAGITFVFFCDMLRRCCPSELQQYLEKCITKLSGFLNPNIEISIREYTTGSHMKPHEAYGIIEAYLSVNSDGARKLKAQITKDNENKLLFSMDENQESIEVFNGVQVTWTSEKVSPPAKPAGSISYFSEPDRRCYKLKFPKAHKKMIMESFLQGHVMKRGREIVARNRQRKLYTNAHGEGYWSHIPFEHPATFETLAMDAEEKQNIINDLISFTEGKEHYERIGKAWKRGYLLHGPPGTGKSTMIAAMANLLDYDVYDLELTSVKDNAELRKLLMATKAKSMIVIEDIDCSLDLTGQRKKMKKKKSKNKSENEETEMEAVSWSRSKVTLSGLLNSTDGLWSACVGERVIVFTTNHVDKLDPALIRKGRMDKPIEFSYCNYQGFRVLARNYLQLEKHPLFEDVEELMKEVQITPADVAEELMPKSDEEGAEQCIRNLIYTLHQRKSKLNGADADK